MDQWNWCFINQKIWRRWVLPIVTGAIVYWISGNIIQSLLVIAAYATTLNAFAWGETNWLRKLVKKRRVQWFVCGLAWGISSFPYTGTMAIYSGILSGFVVLFMMWWSNEAPITIDHKWVEVVSGAVIMIGFLFKTIGG
jgi:hypothetical protein